MAKPLYFISFLRYNNL